MRARAFAQSEALFPVSRPIAHLLTARGVQPARIELVQNGVDAGRFRPLDATEFRRRHDLDGRRVILSVARLVHRKGIDTVIEALPGLAARFPDLMYLVVGDGPERVRLEALVRRLGLEARVRMLGRLAHDDLVACYNACDVFALPVRDEAEDVEGFGLVFLEAGACGRPVVGSRAGGVVDAVVDGETGLLVAPDDPAALAEAIGRLFEDRELAARMGRAGRERVLASGTWDHAARAIAERIVRGEPV
jgi:phosphatidylinositol alpha-1,6-mannosyltransferase